MNAPQNLSNWHVGVFWLEGIKTALSLASLRRGCYKPSMTNHWAAPGFSNNTREALTHDTNQAQGKRIMRCLLSHKWITSWEKTFARSFAPYRRCPRCGIMQRGIYDSLTRDLSWQTMRERTYIAAQQVRIVRRPSSSLDQLAHTLGLRRSRASDRTGPINAAR